MPVESHLFWVDLEMTGLNPHYDHILEIASVVTNSQLEVLAEGPSYAIFQQEYILERMDEWNLKQHTDSGLLKAVRTASVTLEEAYESTLTFARRYCTYKTAPLCGNSVYQDKNFLRQYMPELDNYFHYRIIDVSTVKELVRRWYPEDSCIYFEKKTNHRALEDVYASIEELKHYRKHFFKLNSQLD
jgi:oligoribonuclease